MSESKTVPFVWLHGAGMRRTRAASFLDLAPPRPVVAVRFRSGDCSAKSFYSQRARTRGDVGPGKAEGELLRYEIRTRVQTLERVLARESLAVS